MHHRSVLDQEEEGYFKSINDGNTMSQDLPWYGDNPNQGTDANFVYIHKDSLLDVAEEREACTVCTIYRKLKFSLWGTCKHSFFGKYFH